MKGSVETMNESASWFLVSEDGAPLGQIYCKDGRIEPTVGETLENGQKWKQAEVLSFEGASGLVRHEAFQDRSACHRVGA